MRSTEELKREHVHIKAGLGVLERIAGRLESGGAVPDADLDTLLEFLSVYADKCHHAKEEDCLFPALLAKGMPKEGGPIGIMLDEHVTGRGFIARMREAAAGKRTGNADAPRAFATAARGYVALLREHIEKEDDMLFPMADDTLSSAEDFRLEQQFQEFEVARIGAGRHEQLEAAVARLERAWPPA